MPECEAALVAIARRAAASSEASSGAAAEGSVAGSYDVHWAVSDPEQGGRKGYSGVAILVNTARCQASLNLPTLIT